MTCKQFCMIFLAGTSILWSINAFADSAISSTQSSDTPQPARAQVNFVIKIPYRLSLKTEGSAIKLSSNTGNLLVSNPQQKKSTFTSDNNPIQIQHSTLAGTNFFTAASP